MINIIGTRALISPGLPSRSPCRALPMMALALPLVLAGPTARAAAAPATVTTTSNGTIAGTSGAASSTASFTRVTVKDKADGTAEITTTVTLADGQTRSQTETVARNPHGGYSYTTVIGLPGGLTETVTRTVVKNADGSTTATGADKWSDGRTETVSSTTRGDTTVTTITNDKGQTETLTSVSAKTGNVVTTTTTGTGFNGKTLPAKTTVTTTNPLPCGSTASGSTLMQTVSSTPGQIAATIQQCPYGGTQPTITTVTQAQLCTNGTLSNQGNPVTTVAGNGSPACNPPPASVATSNGSCLGSPTPAPVVGSLLMPPVVPQPALSTDIVGVNLQNTSATATGGAMFTFGQVFKKGQVAPTDALVANINGAPNQVQMDALSNWPDGSVKLAALTMKPNICPNSTLPALLSKATGNNPNFSAIPVSLGRAPVSLTATLAFTGGQYAGTQTIDLGAALKAALTAAPDYWLQGPLAAQARVDVPLPGGPMHITADVTAYADGNVLADVQFNNDIATIIPVSAYPAQSQPALPPQTYTATVTLGGVSQSQTVSQDQYTDWHMVLSTTGAPLMSVSSPNPPVVNVQHDLAYLEHAGAILPYDRTTGVYYNPQNNAFGGFTNILTNNPYSYPAGAPLFGMPLSPNGVTTYMPETGGRADIGYTTGYNTVWLVTGSATAATVALAQSDSSGAAPWNYKLPNGHWLTPGDYPHIWVDGRAYSGWNEDAPTNVVDPNSIWSPDLAHQPNLNYIPYIMTGVRWNLDRLNAQAAYGLSDDWNGPRCPTNNCVAHLDDIVLNAQDVPRQQAWSFREMMEAAFVGHPGSFEQAYYTQAVADNWAYVQSIEQTLQSQGGQVYGYIPNGQGFIKEWQEDYLSGVAELAAEMGDQGALQFIGWQKDAWLAGRFIGQGEDPYDGCAYQTAINSTVNTTNTFSGVPLYTTWAQIETAMATLGWSNGTNFWLQSNGDYCQLARAVLGGALTLFPNDNQMQQALSWLNSANAPYANPAGFQADPTFNVVPLQP